MSQPIIEQSSQDKFIINPNILESKPNILDVENPVETQEEKKEENKDENNIVSETKKIAISEDKTPDSNTNDSNTNDSRKIIL
jgi:hypothetical protein